MKMKTNELTGHALNWAVAMCEGNKVYRPRLGRPSDWDKEAYLRDGSDDRWVVRVQNPDVAHFVDWTYNPAGDWMQGGPIIERECIQLAYRVGVNWTATRVEGSSVCEVTVPYNQRGRAQLIAAMRCYVMSQYGDEIDVPDELKGE
jgi:hypothetical protein